MIVDCGVFGPETYYRMADYLGHCHQKRMVDEQRVVIGEVRTRSCGQ
jgi:hypothetical protein